jgi:hypothetical protein
MTSNWLSQVHSHFPEIKKLIAEEHEYLMKYEANV